MFTNETPRRRPRTPRLKIPLDIPPHLLAHLPLRPPQHRRLSHRTLRRLINNPLRQRNPPRAPSFLFHFHLPQTNDLATHQIPRRDPRPARIQLRHDDGDNLHGRFPRNAVYACGFGWVRVYAGEDCGDDGVEWG